jgi:hypothetical protein
VRPRYAHPVGRFLGVDHLAIGWRRLGAVVERCRGAFEQVGDEVLSHTGIAGVAGGDRGVGDDLGVGIHRDVTLVAVEAPRLGLVPVAGLGVDDRDHPVLGHLGSDAKRSAVIFFQVLNDHGGEEAGGFFDLFFELTVVQDGQAGVGIFGSRVDEALACCLVVPVDLGFGRRRVVVPALDRPAQLVFEVCVDDLQKSPDSRADQGDGVHGGDRVVEGGVESSARFLPTRPAALAAPSAAAKMRSGSAELRSRSRMSTSTV